MGRPEVNGKVVRDPRSALQLKLQGGDRATRAMEVGTGQQEEHGGEQ
jgi:hypothetical protein